MGFECGIKLILALLWGSIYLPGTQNLITLNLACIKTNFTIDDILGPSLSQSVVMVHSVTCKSQEMEASASKDGLFNLSSTSSSPLPTVLALADYEEEGRAMFSSELT